MADNQLSPTPEKPPRARRLVAVTTALSAVTALAVIGVGATSQTAPAAQLPVTPFAVSGGQGATVPFTEYEAESAATNGSKVGPDYTQGTVASEASGRQAVQLSSQGQYVEFTLSKPANAIDVHYNLQDGKSGTLSVYVGGQKAGSELALTSKYQYIDTGNIFGSKTHHFFDDARLMLGQNAAAGTKVRVQVDSGDNAGPYTIDLADFEQVGGAGAQPSNSVSVTDYGATANDGGDDTNGFRQAITAAKSAGKEVWVPQGTFEIPSALQVDQVTIRGAGDWYTVLHGNNIFNNGSASGNIKLYDFAVFGDVTERNDSSPDNAFHGVLGSGSVVSGLWIQDTKCGLWLMSGASSNLAIQNNRIQDTMADGINFDGAVTGSTISNNFVRNTGDDGLALWSNGSPDANDTISDNTVIQPNLANGIAIYGGTSNTVTGNVVADTNALGGGILLANRFSATTMSGTMTVSHNTTIRAGALDPNWQFGVGALWFDARDTAITGVTIDVSDFRAVDSPYEAIQFIDGNGSAKPIQGITIDGVSIEKAGTFAVQAQTGGSVTVNNVTATGIGVTGTYNCPYPSSSSPITINGSGNSGWDGTWGDCSTWPPPNSGPGGGTTTTTTTPPANGNLALHKQISASGYADVYQPARAVDGDAGSYWESTDNAFPQTLTVDLGAATSISRIVLKLPPVSAWGARTQTLAVSGSTDNSNYVSIVGSHGYGFDPSSGNTATISFGATSTRYLRLTFTGNTGWPAGQVSEFEVYAS